MPTIRPAAILQEAKDYADETIKNFHKFGQSQYHLSRIWKQQRSRLREKIDADQSKSQSTTTAKPKGPKQYKPPRQTAHRRSGHGY